VLLVQVKNGAFGAARLPRTTGSVDEQIDRGLGLRTPSADVIPRLSRMDFRSARGVYVVLDATEIHRDWFLVGLEFQLLRFLIRQAGIRAVVPTSVLMEVVANHDREYARARRQLTKVAEGLRRVAGRGALPAPQLWDESAYEDRLVERLENLGIELLPWPETPHEEIVKRATERRPPFDEAGSGYRDTLVWMSCLALARAGRTVFLVSQDKDFAGRDLDLAGALIEEVTDLPGSVTLVRHLGSWLLPLVPWGDVGDLKEAAATARDEEVAFMFAPWDIFEDPDFTREELGLPPSAVIDEISYHGSDSASLERVSHAKTEDGSHKIVYRFPIEFEVLMTLDTDEARAEGYIEHEGSLTGREAVRTVIPMIGEMRVIHDEDRPDEPLYYDSFDFMPVDPSAHYDPNRQIPGQGFLPFETDGSDDG
jgi:hypothetical protein